MQRLVAMASERRNKSSIAAFIDQSKQAVERCHVDFLGVIGSSDEPSRTTDSHRKTELLDISPHEIKKDSLAKGLSKADTALQQTAVTTLDEFVAMSGLLVNQSPMCINFHKFDSKKSYPRS
jgi:hypothetical protein